MMMADILRTKRRDIMIYPPFGKMMGWADGCCSLLSDCVAFNSDCRDRAEFPGLLRCGGRASLGIVQKNLRAQRMTHCLSGSGWQDPISGSILRRSAIDKSAADDFAG
jgi:hypothetical protein